MCSTRGKNYFQLDTNVYVPLKNNGNHNLGVLCLNGVVERFLDQVHEIKDGILDYLGSHCGQMLAASRQLEESTNAAEIDQLTGLYNRRKLDTTLPPLVEDLKQHDGELSFLMLDIDKFKSYNDAYGHQQGDKALKAVAKALSESVRRTDFCARYGGEEFCIALPGANFQQATRIAETVRRNIESALIDTSALSVEAQKQEYRPGYTPHRVTCSIGVATLRGFSETAEELIKMADQQLYWIKQYCGRNKVGVPKWECPLLHEYILERG